MPASDFLESAASGSAALLPRFLVKQLKPSNKLCLYRYKGMAGLPKYFQGTLLGVTGAGGRLALHSQVCRYRSSRMPDSTGWHVQTEEWAVTIS